MERHTLANDEEVVCMTVQIDDSSTMESDLWRNTGPSAFQLQRLC